MDKRIMKRFLKSGFIYEGKLFPTDTGSPQGGAISSLYANMTLDGLEKLIQEKYSIRLDSKIKSSTYRMD
jgi:RNA-directed DNA polymerase